MHLLSDYTGAATPTYVPLHYIFAAHLKPQSTLPKSTLTDTARWWQHRAIAFLLHPRQATLPANVINHRC